MLTFFLAVAVAELVIALCLVGMVVWLWCIMTAVTGRRPWPRLRPLRFRPRCCGCYAKKLDHQWYPVPCSPEHLMLMSKR
jgi:hypothetical protein